MTDPTPQTPTRAEAVRRDEQLRIQAVGAAISRRDWHAVEQAYNAIRDEFDRRPLASTPAPASGRVDAVAWQYRYNGNWYVVDNEAFAKQGVDVTPLFAHPPSPSLAPAWTDVLAERRRQVEAEGWTPEHDDVHSRGEMAQAAAVYALCSAVPPPDRAVMDEFGQYNSVPFKIRNRWPWGEVWLKPKDRRSDLVRAAALILAEIERLDRKEGVR